MVVCAHSQSLSNLRIKELTLQSDTLKLDTLSIISNSVIVQNLPDFKNLADLQTLPDSLYTIDYVKSTIIFTNLKNQKLKITYRTFPVDFSKEYAHKQTDRIITKNIYTPKTNKTSEIDESSFLSNDQLKKNGSISRGINIGNNQDMSVTSYLNLQISGKLTDSVSVQASIIDYLPTPNDQGNTQQVQDFDNVFIKVYSPKTSFSLGDLKIKKPTGYFMNVNKKIRGLQLSTEFQADTNLLVRTTNSAAVSKGVYNRMTFNGIEANQGPYRLTGANNELYILIVPNSEKIYIDGKPLTKGETNDYTIDYNTGELTFTANQPITKDKRIIAEFEYSNKYYSNYLFYSANEIATRKSKFHFNFYSESDAKNQPILQELTNNQKQTLAKIGDSLNRAFSRSADTVKFTNDLVLYRITDTLVNGKVYDSIFVYSTNLQNAKYRLSFSYLGENKGNYIQTTSTANGKVFQWIASKNNIPQGSYEPVILLVSPKKKQLITFGGDTKFSTQTSANYEFAFSKNDLNTFSTKDKADDNGIALNVSVKHQFFNVKNNGFQLNSTVNYSFIDKNFSAIERFRSAEFEREWNTKDTKLTHNEHYAAVILNFKSKNNSVIQYNSELMNRGENLSAFRNSVSTQLKIKSFEIISNASYLISKDLINETKFLKYSVLLQQNFGKKIKIGIKQDAEDNRWKRLNNDSLLLNSLKFVENACFIENYDTSFFHFNLKYKQRIDFVPVGNQFNKSVQSNDYMLTTNLKNKTKMFDWNLISNVTYRQLSTNDTILLKNAAKNNFIGNLNYNLRAFGNVLATSSFIEKSTGMEAKREYTYVEVEAGKGIYKWIDYNHNEIKELNEFEIANFTDEGVYIRIMLPSNEYAKTYSMQFNQTIEIQTPANWKKSSGIKLFLSRFSESAYLKINRKDFNNTVNVFGNADNSVSFNSNFRNVFSFNKNASVGAVDYIFQKSQNKVLLFNGLENSESVFSSIVLRKRIVENLNVICTLTDGNKNFSSEYFTQKNYKIVYNEALITLNKQSAQNVQVDLNYQFSAKKNSLAVETVSIQKIGLETRYNTLNKSNLVASANYLKVKFFGNEYSPAAFSMLDGYENGNNFNWTLTVDYTLINNLQLNVSYNGRKGNADKIIHTGNVQLKMSFL